MSTVTHFLKFIVEDRDLKQLKKMAAYLLNTCRIGKYSNVHILYGSTILYCTCQFNLQCGGVTAIVEQEKKFVPPGCTSGKCGGPVLDSRLKGRSAIFHCK